VEYWAGKKLAGHHLDSGSPEFFRTTVAGNVVFLPGSVGLDENVSEVVSGVLEEQWDPVLDRLRIARQEAGVP